MYAPEVVNFTTAHELGHALLHDQVELHRDIPLDGSEILQNHSITERQANKFAAYFLMPGKTVIQLFYEIFQIEIFEINELTSNKLGYKSPRELRKGIRNQRDLSRLIAKCEFYDFRPFNSLSKMFKVSVEAMAIRLEELNLIKFE
jgi:Zn-dependent peptidase ImmA (M78 family)